MADPPDEPEDTNSWTPPERQLRSDGRMTGDQHPRAPDPASGGPAAPDPSGLPSLDALTTSELVLDTSKPGGRPKYVEPEGYRPLVLPDRRGPVKWVLLLVALGAAAFAAFALIPGLQHRLPLPAGAKASLVIYSEPSGATVKIGGKAVGQTPWAGDNLWGGEVKYEISAPGYQSNWGTFQGGQDVKLNVKLSKK